MKKINQCYSYTPAAIDFEGMPSLNEMITRGVSASAKILSDYLFILLIIGFGYFLLGLIGLFSKRKTCSRDYRYLFIGIILLVITYYLASYTGLNAPFFGTRTFSGEGYY